MKYLLRQNLVEQKKKNSVILLDSDESILYTLNDTASYIYGLLKERLDDSEIKKRIMKKYKITEKQSKKDFEEFITDLKKRGIISEYTSLQ